MDREYIIGNNTIINAFMGYPNNMNEDGGYPDSVFYHKDWNLIMDVVDKIESLNFSDKDIVLYYGKSPFVNNKYIAGFKQNFVCNGEYYGAEALCETKILAVWQAVVNFILWYNLTKK